MEGTRTNAPAAPRVWDQPVRSLRRVGPDAADKLAKLGIAVLGDLLSHYPFRYVDRRTVTPLGSLRRRDLFSAGWGDDPDTVTVLGRIVDFREAPRRVRGRRGGVRLPSVLRLRDDTGVLEVPFFGPGWKASLFPVGATLIASGRLKVFRGDVQLVNPEFEVLAGEEEADIHLGKLFPVYPSTAGITQRQLRNWVREALARWNSEKSETLPDDLRERYKLAGLDRALHDIHFPATPEAQQAARRRLAFEELLADQLLMGTLRLRRALGRMGRALTTDGPLVRRVRAGLPFDLTGDQVKALAEILADLGAPRPMNRLLQGDVGSGKTVVALLAAAAAADSGVQTAVMAPTEILAEQHYRTLRDLAEPFGLAPRLLTGATKGAARREVLRVLADGSCPLAVGTHALFQDEVRFFDLGLVVVDEQHRFGVIQRMALWEKGDAPHVLVMSATPIPRSLALVRYADLDLSVIRERPKGRQPVTTRVTFEPKREAVYAFTAEKLHEGRQAFVIYPLVEETGKSELKAATTMVETLRARPEFARFTVELLHGQMKSEEKDSVMQRFAAGEVQLLAATTVVEVGIDVPNAAVLVVEHPERYGLSQLHQLRGRVGRGEHRAYCILLVGDGVDADARERLERFAATDDGFEIARMDLAFRGQGELTGTRQSGRPVYRLADPIADERMLLEARDRARELLEHGEFETRPDWEPLRERIRGWLGRLDAVIEVG